MTGFAWARLRDNSSGHGRVAHLIHVPIVDRRMSVCSTALDGRSWVPQEASDPTRRCGKCEEAARNYLHDKIIKPPSEVRALT